VHSAQLSFRLPWGHGLHSAQLYFSLPWVQQLHSAQLPVSLPLGQALHSAQLAFSLPCGHGLHSTQTDFFGLPCWQRFISNSTPANSRAGTPRVSTVSCSASRCERRLCKTCQFILWLVKRLSTCGVAWRA